jgi:hypothetical protein
MNPLTARHRDSFEAEEVNPVPTQIREQRFSSRGGRNIIKVRPLQGRPDLGQSERKGSRDLAAGELATMSFDEVGKTMLRNMLLGTWAAEKLGLTGADANAYSVALAAGTTDPERADVFTKVRKDFDAAAVSQTDEQILGVMTQFMIQAGNQMQGTPGNSLDAAATVLMRNLSSR